MKIERSLRPLVAHHTRDVAAPAKRSMSKEDTPPESSKGRDGRDPLEQQAARQRFAASARDLEVTAPSGEQRTLSRGLRSGEGGAPFTTGGRAYANVEQYVRYQASEGVLTGKEVHRALSRGASPEQIKAWSRGETISESGRQLLAEADPKAAFTKDGRRYASAKDWIERRGADGLGGDEVREALRRGATPKDIASWAAGQKMSDGARRALTTAAASRDIGLAESTATGTGRARAPSGEQRAFAPTAGAQTTQDRMGRAGARRSTPAPPTSSDGPLPSQPPPRSVPPHPPQPNEPPAWSTLPPATDPPPASAPVASPSESAPRPAVPRPGATPPPHPPSASPPPRRPGPAVPPPAPPPPGRESPVAPPRGAPGHADWRGGTEHGDSRTTT